VLRERKEELTTPMAFVANQDVVYPGIGIPRDLPLTRLELALEGQLRLTGQTVAGSYFPEAPQSLIRRVRVRGTKVSGGGTITLVDIRGEEAALLTRAYDQYSPVGMGTGGSGGSVMDFAGTGDVQFPTFPSATANIQADFRVHYAVPFAPPMALASDEVQGILDPSIFSQLDLIVSFGDSTYLINGQTATVALNAFGSASGAPQVIVTRFAPLAEGLPIMRYHYTVLSKYINVGAQLSTSASNSKIADINVGNRIRTVMLRQYSEQAGQVGLASFSGSGAGSTSNLRIGDNSNIGIYRWYVKLNGTPKWQMRNPDAREWDRRIYNSVQSLFPQGYTLIDWGDRGFVNDTIFDTRGYGATATRFELHGDWLNLAATDRLDMLQIEQVPVEV
jgi:hypothetical protein